MHILSFTVIALRWVLEGLLLVLSVGFSFRASVSLVKIIVKAIKYLVRLADKLANTFADKLANKLPDKLANTLDDKLDDKMAKTTVRESYDWSGECHVPECTAPVDIVLRSSDGKRFGTHKKNLEVFNDGFPYSDSVVHEPDEDVTLTEHSKHLQLLLRFSHSIDQPDLELKNMKAALEFARVADKYGNSLLMQACGRAMEEFGQRSAVDSLSTVCYKVHYHELDGIDEFARRSMSLLSQQVRARTRDYPEIYVIWTQYKEKWQIAIGRFHQCVAQRDTSYSCDRGDYIVRGRVTPRDGNAIRLLQAQVTQDGVPTIQNLTRVMDLVRKADGLVTQKFWDMKKRALERIIAEFPIWTDFSA
ncbi:hypothetical protein VNI00_017057 [Paramarasmius palmivorus]|uniref:BTB domain-containing protein n=1 Tax=Paramarasmius palmivorus TaxID=297713 RepID=A0AAW0B712_9AGAR